MPRGQNGKLLEAISEMASYIRLIPLHIINEIAYNEKPIRERQAGSILVNSVLEQALIQVKARSNKASCLVY